MPPKGSMKRRKNNRSKFALLKFNLRGKKKQSTKSFRPSKKPESDTSDTSSTSARISPKRDAYSSSPASSPTSTRLRKQLGKKVKQVKKAQGQGLYAEKMFDQVTQWKKLQQKGLTPDKILTAGSELNRQLGKRVASIKKPLPQDTGETAAANTSSRRTRGTTSTPPPQTSSRHLHDLEHAASIRRKMENDRRKKGMAGQSGILAGLYQITEHSITVGLDGLDKAEGLRQSGDFEEALKISQLSLEILIQFLRSDPSILPQIGRASVRDRVHYALTNAEEMKEILTSQRESAKSTSLSQQGSAKASSFSQQGSAKASSVSQHGSVKTSSFSQHGSVQAPSFSQQGSVKDQSSFSQPGSVKIASAASAEQLSVEIEEEQQSREIELEYSPEIEEMPQFPIPPQDEEMLLFPVADAMREHPPQPLRQPVALRQPVRARPSPAGQLLTDAEELKNSMRSQPEIVRPSPTGHILADEAPSVQTEKTPAILVDQTPSVFMARTRSILVDKQPSVLTEATPSVITTHSVLTGKSQPGLTEKTNVSTAQALAASEAMKRVIKSKRVKSRKTPSSTAGQVHISVDLDHPERNLPFYILPVHDIPGIDGSICYEGIAIMTRVDPEWALDDPEVEPFTVRVSSPNLLTAQLPSYSWNLTSDEARIGFSKQLPAFFSSAIDHAREERDKDRKKQKFTTYVLEFPPSYNFSSRVINEDAGENEELELSMAKIEYEKFLGIGTNEENWACWAVARLDAPPSKKKTKSKAMELLTRKSRRALFQSNSESTGAEPTERLSRLARGASIRKAAADTSSNGSERILGADPSGFACHRFCIGGGG